MIILKPFEKCPICSRAGQDNTWIKKVHNEVFRERICSNHFNQCEFSEIYYSSTSWLNEEIEINYITWRLKNFHCYTYSSSFEGIGGETRFYHHDPRNPYVRIIFQRWPNFTPDWDNLEKLNNKLCLLRVFE